MARQPDQTRQRLLEAAFWEIYRNGFQAASIDRILEGTGLTKGALYHHFPSKTRLGVAVLEELVRPWVIGRWERALATTDPIAGLTEAMSQGLEGMPDDQPYAGCPLFSLAQELHHDDTGFRDHLDRAIGEWRALIASRLSDGQARGLVRADLEPKSAAAFLLAAHQGIEAMARATRDPGLVARLRLVLRSLIETLRPAAPGSAVRR